MSGRASRLSRQKADAPASVTAVSLEQLIDSEVSDTLKRAVDAIGPERRLLLLTIAEHPELDNRVERVIAAIGEELR